MHTVAEETCQKKRKHTHKVTFAALAAMAVALSVAMLVSSVASPVQAKIQAVDTSCTNGGGNQPGDQQPTYTGGGLTQEIENQNPSGSAPPGQNK
ncbi:MAG TPA: hypothetical protein VFY68_00070 [Nitrososphaeraceae archaeon]|nr:hypothetical protein [Nitrososphaeraceae archaeon]